jgi:hypothetical protein
MFSECFTSTRPGSLQPIEVMMNSENGIVKGRLGKMDC